MQVRISSEMRSRVVSSCVFFVSKWEEMGDEIEPLIVGWSPLTDPSLWLVMIEISRPPRMLCNSSAAWILFGSWVRISRLCLSFFDCGKCVIELPEFQSFDWVGSRPVYSIQRLDMKSRSDHQESWIRTELERARPLSRISLPTHDAKSKKGKSRILRSYSPSDNS